MTLGLFIPLEDAKMWLVVRGVVQAVKDKNASLVIYGSATEKSYSLLNKDLLSRSYSFSPLRHDGVIFAFAGAALRQYAEELWKEGLPVSLIARKQGDVPFAASNNRETVCQAVRAFADKGHKQIGFIAGPPDNLSAQERLAGYKEGLEKSGLRFDESLVLQGDYTEKTAKTRTLESLSKGFEVTAIVAANDLSAIGAMEALRAGGLSPGADVELVGFDNIPRAHWVNPSLSSFDPRLYQMGYRACEELIKRIGGETFDRAVEVPTVFVPRRSTWESSAERKVDHPLELEWIADCFLFEAQLESLRRAPHARALIEQLKSSTDSPESFLQTFRELHTEATRMGFNALCLFPILQNLGGLSTGSDSGERESSHELVEKALGILSAAVFDEHKMQAEVALRYGAATVRLRELAFNSAKESAVLKALEQTVDELEIRRAGVFLAETGDNPAGGEVPRGGWFWCGHEAPHRNLAGAKDPFDISELKTEQEGDNCWLFFPLLHDDTLLGIVLLDADKEYLVHYPDLVRLFSVALNATRMNEALGKANAELIETSRLAGLAEMATGVLHNIGNALNSVNTSCSVAADLVRKSKVAQLSRAVQMLSENKDRLGDFLVNDPKGKLLPDFLGQVSAHLVSEQGSLLKELDQLRATIDHINQIVAAQQSYAHVSALTEEIDTLELMEFALKLSEASLVRHSITVRRAFASVPKIKAQRQKAVQILVNLIRNAKDAMDEEAPQEKILTLELAAGAPGRVLLKIGDNGKGIDPANLSRIFAFGFSTKKGGHGFGLHNSALAAREMGGSLSAQSEGPHRGSTFILELPC